MPVLLLLIALQETQRTAAVRLYADRPTLVTQADELAEKGKWPKVIEIYAEAIDLDRDGLVHVGKERYISVFDFVQKRLAELPPEAVAEYRRRYDAVVQNGLAQAAAAGDADALAALIETYPLSSHLDEVLAVRARLALDAGDTDVAAATLERLAALGDTDIPAERTIAQLAEAYALAGRAADLDALKDRVAGDPRDLVVGNRRTTLGEFVESLRPRRRPVDVSNLLADEWTQLGGDAGGFRHAADLARLPGKIWDVALPNVEMISRSGDLRYNRGPASFASIFPAVADGTLFVHNEYEVRAYALYARKPQLIWSFRMPELRGELEPNPNALQTITVLGGRVFAPLIVRLGESIVRKGNIPVTYPFPRRALVALDAGTGALLWQVGGETDSIPLAPATDGRYLYAGIVEQRHPTDPFRHYVVCLDPADGRERWRTFVASGHTEINLFGNSARESTGSPVAVAGDTVVYVTHHGAVAALDRATGRIRWLERYTQWEINPTRNLYPMLNTPTWHNRAPLVYGGHVYFAPTDSDYLFRRELRTGLDAGRIERPFEARYVLGAADDKIILGGHALYAFKPDFTPAWTYLGDKGFGGGGALSNGRVYHPSYKGIRIVDVRDGAALDAREYSMESEHDFTVNLIALPDVLLIAGGRSVRICFEPSALARRVGEIAAADGAPPELLYEAALKSMVQQDDAETIRLLRRVREATQGSRKPVRERIHAATGRHLFVMLGDAALKQLELESNAEAATLLTEAVTLAPTPDQLASFTIVLAEAQRRAGDPARALRTLHELNRDHGDRALDDSTVRAAVQLRIDALLAEHGRDLYAAYEAEARSRLERADRPDALLRLADLYPNSEAATAARRKAMELTIERGDVRDAFEMVRATLQAQPPSDGLADTAARFVEALEGRGYTHVARTVLLMMRARLGERRVGRTPVADFVRDRLASEAYRLADDPTPAAPRFPLSRVGTYTDASLHSGVPVASADLIYVDFGTAVRALDPADMTLSWTQRMRGPILAAGRAGDTAAFVGPREARASGWSMPSASEIHAALASRGILYISRQHETDASLAEIIALDIATGIRLWNYIYHGRPAARLDVCGDELVFVALDPARIFMLEAFTGRRDRLELMRAPQLRYAVVAADAEGVEIRGESDLDGFVRWNVGADRPRWHANAAFIRGALWAVGPGHHVGIGRFTTADNHNYWLMRCYDRRTAKLAGYPDRPEALDALALAVTETHAIVAVGEGGRATAIRGLRLPGFELDWERPLPEGSELIGEPMRAGDAVVFVTGAKQAGATMTMKILVIDSKGQVLQEIDGDRAYERPPSVELSNNGIVIGVEQEVQYWR